MNCGLVQGVLPSLMKVTYWGTPFPRVLAHGATHAHQLKESQAKTLPMGIIAMRQKNVNRVNCGERVERVWRGELYNLLYVNVGFPHRPIQDILPVDLFIPEVVHTLNEGFNLIYFPSVLVMKYQHHGGIAC